MMGRYALFVCLLSFATTNVAVAQTACPVGVQPGAAVCGPDPNANVGQSNRSAPRQALPTGEWLDRWGAIYYDEASSSLGVAKNRRDKGEAEEVAKTACNSDGAQDCRAVLSYRNACVAVAKHVSSGAIGFATREKLRAASRAAVDNCKKSAGGTCELSYSSCSDPVFSKF